MKLSAAVITPLLLLAACIYLFSPILPPFIAGAFFAWLLNPLVTRLVRLQIPRLLAVLLVFLMLVFFITVILVLALPRLGAEISRLIHLMPGVASFIQKQIPADISDAIATDMTSLRASLADNWMKAGGMIGLAAQTIFHSGARLAKWLGYLILVPVVALYLLYDWDHVIASVERLLPRKYAATVVALARQCDAVLAAFFRGQLLVMLTLGVIYSVGLTVIGLQLGVLIGLMIGLFAIIPYLGVITGFVAACIAAWVQFGAWHALLPVIGLFAVVQLMDGMFITPRLVGHRIGLHPVLVIFAVLAGGAIAGFTGVLVALPVAAMIRVLFVFFAGRKGVVCE